jgi:hypothetical protein
MVHDCDTLGRAAAVIGTLSILAACQRVVVGAGRAPTTAVRPIAALPLEVSASTALVRAGDGAHRGPSVETRVILRNLGVAPLKLTLSTVCTVMVRIFETPERQGQQVWGSGNYPGSCKGVDLPRTVAGGAADTLHERIPIQLILGDSLRRGRIYYFSAHVVIREVPGQHVELPAGALRLPP